MASVFKCIGNHINQLMAKSIGKFAAKIATLATVSRDGFNLEFHPNPATFGFGPEPPVKTEPSTELTFKNLTKFTQLSQETLQAVIDCLVKRIQTTSSTDEALMIDFRLSNGQVLIIRQAGQSMTFVDKAKIKDSRQTFANKEQVSRYGNSLRAKIV